MTIFTSFKDAIDLEEPIPYFFPPIDLEKSTILETFPFSFKDLRIIVERPKVVS